MANQIIGQIIQILGSSSMRRNLSILLVLVFSIVGFGYLIFWNNQPDFQVLFSNLSPEDGGEMVAKLKEKKIPFQFTGNGTTLLVPRDQVYDLRLSFAAEGLPKGGGVGFEVFDRTNLGVTDFVQKLNYQRALQGELSRTIRQIREIEQARVHIVTPKESLFVEEQKKSTASVFIKTRSGMALAPPQVEGIVHLVASAVEGLEPGNITVVDTSGKVLTRKTDSTLIGQLSTNQLEYQKNSEEALKKKVQGMLEEVLGVNKAIARVSMDIDFQQVELTEERYEPNTVLRSEQRNMERSSAQSGTGATRGMGQTDSKSPKKGGESSNKGPGDYGPSQNSNSSERQNEIRNYEISKINRHVKNPVGQVKKVSVAVIVDGSYKAGPGEKGRENRQFVPRSQEEMKNLENIVKKAIGYSEERGDQVEVINMPFYGALPEEDGKGVIGPPWWQEYLLVAYKPIVSVILAVLFIFFVLKPLLKKKAFTLTHEPPLLQPAPAALAPLEAPKEHAREAAPIQSLLGLKSQAVKLAQEDPTKAVGIVKSWLRERE